MSRFFITFLFLSATFFAFARHAEAISFSAQKPSQSEIIQTILDVSGKTDARAVLLYGLLGLETGFGANTGKTEAQWSTICAERDTKACRYWKRLDCKPDYFNAKHYDEILEYLGYSKKDVPTSYTCALGFTQFEPNTWWGLMQRKNLKDLNPWSIQDAVLMAAYYLEERGATKHETLEGSQVIGSSDKIALQRYYCGPNYARAECVGYAASAARIAARAPAELFRKDLGDQLEIFKEGQETIKKKFEERTKPRFKPIRLPIFQPEPPQTFMPPLGIPPPPSFATPEIPREMSYPSIEFRALEDTTVGITYRAALSASGGVPPYQWKLSGEKLPEGLTLDSAQGVISGMPEKGGGAGFFITVIDSAGTESIPTWLTIMVNDAPEVFVYDLPRALRDSFFRSDIYIGGGAPPYKWKIRNLPDGLNLDPETGTISGTPAKLGKYDVSISVTDSNGASSQEKQFQLYVVETPIIAEKTLPKGKVGVPYDASIEVSGGISPYQFIVFSVANLPDGIAVDSSSGKILGTPKESGYYYVNVKVMDSLSTESNWANILLIVESAPSVSTLDLPQGFVGMPYRMKLYSSGGIAPHTWEMDSVTKLPEGMNFDAGGILLGTPTQSGMYKITVVVYDTERTKSEPRSLTLSIVEKPSIVTKSAFPDGSVRSEYKATLSATGGVPPYAFSLANESQKLPDGLTLDPSTGVIAGTSAKSGWYGFFVEVTDSIGTKSNWGWFSISITELQIFAATSTLNRGFLGTSYYAQLSVGGGAAPYTWSIATSTPLPDGLVLDPATGVISGKPTKVGTYNFSVTVRGANKLTSEAKTFTISIVEKPKIINDAALPPATVGVAYATLLTASGGVPPHTWRFVTTTDKLPTGLMLDTAAGIISGIPTEAGGFGFSIKVTDSIGTDSDWPWFTILVGASKSETPTATSTIATSTSPTTLLDFQAIAFILQKILFQFGE